MRRFALLFFCLWLPLSGAPASAASSEPPEPTKARLNDCNWIVTYRGRTYDLAPLTREALARPIETDIRYALQRVPAANAHLEAMGQRLRDARAHSVIASIFLGGVIVTRLLHSRYDRASDQAKSYDVLTYASAGFSLSGLFLAWRATADAKQELVAAVDSFNEKSPYKIQPAVSNRPLLETPDAGEIPEGPDDAEKNRP